MTVRFSPPTARRRLAALTMAAALMGDLSAWAGPRTGFDAGHDGWLAGRQVEGIMWVDAAVGAPAPAIHHVQVGTQGSMMFNRRPRWVAPLRTGLPVQMALDVEARIVTFQGRPVRRELVLEVRDHTNPPPGYPYTSVWTVIGHLDSSRPGPRRLAVTITDPTATTLPTGWGGYGAETPDGLPTLPEGRTFADVLAHADELAITTFQPGYFYGIDHAFDVVYDNIVVRNLEP